MEHTLNQHSSKRKKRDSEEIKPSTSKSGTFKSSSTESLSFEEEIQQNKTVIDFNFSV